MKLKKIIAILVMMVSSFALFQVAHAYNGKFAYNLKSGWMSNWAYTSAAYKASESENPVVSATYMSGATKNFVYDVTNSDSHSRVVPFTKYGTFSLRSFERNTMKKGYKYYLRIKRDGGEFWDSASVQGLWNPDSY